MKFKCKFCNKEFDNYRARNGHETLCKFNPMFKTTMQKKIKNRTLAIPMKIICPKCGKAHTEYITPHCFEIGKYKHYCSHACANSHHVSNEQKEKVKKSLTAYLAKTPKTLKKYTCKICGKEFDSRTSSSKIFCSKECHEENFKNFHKYNQSYCDKMSQIAIAGHYGRC